MLATLWEQIIFSIASARINVTGVQEEVTWTVLMKAINNMWLFYTIIAFEGFVSSFMGKKFKLL